MEVKQTLHTIGNANYRWSDGGNECDYQGVFQKNFFGNPLTEKPLFADFCCLLPPFPFARFVISCLPVGRSEASLVTNLTSELG